MTISSTVRKAGPFAGNSVTTAFAFAFKVFQAADVLVVLTDSAGNQVTQTLTSQYTVSLNANQDSNPGGTVNMIAAPPTGYTLTIASQVAQTQSVVLLNLGGFNPQVVDDEFDRLTILVQQMQETLNRSFSFPISDPALNAQMPTAAQRANLFLGFDGSGNAIAAANGGSVTSAAMIPVLNAASLAASQAAYFGENVTITADTGRYGGAGARFRTTLVNSPTGITLMPNGTSTSSELRLYNKDDVTGANLGALSLVANGAAATLNGIGFGTGTVPTSISSNLLWTFNPSGGTPTLSVNAASLFVNRASGDGSGMFMQVSGGVSTGGDLFASGRVIAQGGNVPGVGAQSVQAWVNGGAQPVLTFTDSAQSVNNRFAEWFWSGGVFKLRFLNDAYNTAVDALSITGSQAAGLTSIASQTPQLILNNPGATVYMGTAAGSGALSNDNGTTYFVLYGHSNAAAGNVDLVGGNLRLGTGLVSAASGFRGASTLGIQASQEFNTLAGNTQSSTLTANPSSGLISVRNVTDGGGGLFFVDSAGATVLVTSIGGNMNVGDSGASTNKICVIGSGGAISIYNRYATAKRISVSMLTAQ